MKDRKCQVTEQDWNPKPFSSQTNTQPFSQAVKFERNFKLNSGHFSNMQLTSP